MRQELLGGGRLRFDRRLPFACVYRQRKGDDDPGTEQLLAAETSCMIIPADARAAKHCTALLHAIVENLANYFGSFLVVEIWADSRAKVSKSKSNDANGAAVHSRFEIVVPEHRTARATIESLSKSLSKIRTLRCEAQVSIARRDAPCPPGVQPILTRTDSRHLNSFTMGIAIRPVYREGDKKQVNPRRATDDSARIECGVAACVLHVCSSADECRSRCTMSWDGSRSSKPCWRWTISWRRSVDRLTCCCRRRRSTPNRPGANFAATIRQAAGVLLSAADARSAAIEAAAVHDSGRADRRSDAVVSLSTEAG